MAEPMQEHMMWSPPVMDPPIVDQQAWMPSTELPPPMASAGQVGVAEAFTSSAPTAPFENVTPITTEGPARIPAVPRRPDAPAQVGTFRILNVISEGAPTTYLYPGPTETKDTVELEPQDGDRVYSIESPSWRVREFRAPGRPTETFIGMKKTHANVIVTDSRVALGCSKYESGPKLHALSLGALPAQLAFNAVTSITSARKRAGSMMVGQARYPWVLSVGYTEKSGMLSANSVRIGIANPNEPGIKNSLFFEIDMPGVPTREVARDITRRTAIDGLEHPTGELTPERERLLEGLTRGTDPEPVPHGFATHFFVSAPGGAPLPSSLVRTFRGEPQ